MQTKDFLLHKSLIESDFLLIEKSLSNKLAIVDKKINIKRVESVSLLDGFSMLKSVKQFISLVLFTKTYNKKLHIIANKKQQYYFLKLVLAKNFTTLENVLCIHNTFDFLIKEPINNDIVVVLDSALLSNNSHLIQRLFSNQIYLIHSINTILETNSFGTYKIFNNFKDYKKLIFLIALIEKIYKTN